MDLPTVITQPTTEPTPAPKPGLSAGRWCWRVFLFPVKLLIGATFCQGMFASVMVLGWTHRISQRIAFKHWWKRSQHREQGGTFREFLNEEDATAGHSFWPNWFVEQDFLSLFQSRPAGEGGQQAWDIFRGITASLRRNLVLGIQGAFNVFLLTLPAGLMWWVGWDYGWNLSFFKGYEQFSVGVSIFAIGSLLFVGVMFYLPLAQARQSVTGDWRAFWNVDLVIRILRSQWIWVLMLSGFLALLCLPVLGLQLTLPNLSESQNIETVEQAKQFVTNYSYYCALFVLPAFVITRVLAAKIYAHGLLRGVQEGKIELTELAPPEHAVLERLNLHRSKPPVLQHWFWKIAGWLGSRIGQFFSAAILFWVWLALVAAIVFTQFLSYHEAGRGWWNQQLIQLPWFQYMPTHIQPVGEEVSSALFLALLVMTLRYLYQFIHETIRRRQLPD